MSPCVAPLIQVNLQPEIMCKRDPGSKQKEQSDVLDKFRLAKLEFVLLMYLTVKSKMFFGSLLWTHDQIPLRDDNEYTFMLEKKEPLDTNMFESLFSCSFLNDLIISLVFLYWSYCTLVCVIFFFLVDFVEERLWWPLQSPNIGGKKKVSN